MEKVYDLNAIHNFDNEFGKFVDWFMKSDLAADTVLIVTADHAAYPSEERKELFGAEKFPADFMNEVPFIGFYKAVEPAKFDADGRNSLDSAPTLLHMLRIREAKNYFLGCSLFESKCALQFHYAYNAGNAFFGSKHGHATELRNKEMRRKIMDFYNLSENDEGGR